MPNCFTGYGTAFYINLSDGGNQILISVPLEIAEEFAPYIQNSTSVANAIGYESFKAIVEPGYKLDKWTVKDNNGSLGGIVLINSSFVMENYTFNFIELWYGEEKWSPTLASVVVNYGDDIATSTRYYSEYTTITYTIYHLATDSSEEIVTYQITNPIYKVINYGNVEGVHVSSYRVPDLEDGESYDITPNLGLKNYDIGFG